MPSWVPDWWPLALVWLFSNVVVGAAVGLAVLVTVRIGYTRRALAQWVGETVEQKPATQMPIGRAQVQGTYLMQRLPQPAVVGADQVAYPAAVGRSAHARVVLDAIGHVEELVEASSLGTPEAVELRRQGRRGLDNTRHLTGMPEEQADWEADDDEQDPPAGGPPSPGPPAPPAYRHDWGAAVPAPPHRYALPGSWMLAEGRRVAAYLTEPIRIRCPDGVHHHRPGARSLRKVLGHRPPPRPADRVGVHREEHAPGTAAQRWGLA